MQLLETRGFIADLDGTLVPEGAMEADSRLTAAFSELSPEIPVHIATGRSYDFCRPIFASLGIAQPAIVENGALIIDPISGYVHHELTISEQVTSVVLDICTKLAPNEQCRFVGDPEDTESVVNERKAYANRGIFILDLPRQKAEEIARHLRGTAIYSYISSSWSENNELCDVNIHHPNATKGHALRVLADMQSYNLKTLLAAGNDVNDLPMFMLVGATAAPADANPVVLRKADFIFSPAKETGFLEILNVFLRR